MDDQTVNLMVSQAPNFVGFLIMSLFMWRIIDRLLKSIEMLIVDCIEDNAYNDNAIDGNIRPDDDIA